MYPGLTAPLLVLLGGALAFILVVAIRQPVLRRLALRQVSRRPTEAALVVAGSLLGTAIIVGSLVVGDTLNFSIRQAAYTTLGPVDERITSVVPARGDAVEARLDTLRTDPDVDGVLTARADQATAVIGTGTSRTAEPRTIVWELDFAAAARFGGTDSGLSVPAPPSGGVVINQSLADALSVHAGSVVTFYLYGVATPARVAQVVPVRGLAGIGTGAAVNHDAFFLPGTLTAAATRAGGGTQPKTITFVSNRGGVEGGATLTDAVTAKIEALIRPLGGSGTGVETPKREVLDAASRTGNALGSLFLFIGSFSIIAGILLLMIIFVMLSEDRKSQSGMLRAVGMKRGRLVRAFMLEGTVYNALASAIGVGLGIGVGRAVVVVANQIFNGTATDEQRLTLAFKVTPVSLINGFALGFLIAFATVALTTIRISRLNIISAIRDLPAATDRRMKTVTVVVFSVLALLVAFASVPSIAASSGVGTYALPSLAVLLTIPALRRRFAAHRVYTGAALAVLAWALLAPVARPHMFDSGGTTVYITEAIVLIFSSVVLLTENQNVVLRPFRRLISRPSEAGLAARLAVAYPLARRLRTGSTLGMYSLVILVIVLLATISSVIGAATDSAVASASGGYSVRVDYNPSTPIADPARTLTAGPLAGLTSGAVPLLSARAKATDPGRKTATPLDVTLVGMPGALSGRFPLDGRLPGLTTDGAVYQRVLDDPRYVLVDRYFGVQGGVSSQTFGPGSTFTVTSLQGGPAETKIIAGLIRSPMAFYGVGGGGFAFPVLMNESATRHLAGAGAVFSSALVAAAPGVSAGRLAAALQGQFLTSGLVATQIRQAVEQNFAASRSFFQLMQGFLALGLLVGITGLGVVMVQAVRERRRTIGVLRALGFRSRTIEASFLLETTFVAVEGIVLGVGLALLTTYLLYTSSTVFAGLSGPFSIPWLTIGVLMVATLSMSLIATIGPARRAARIRPAVAVRVAD